MHRRRTCNAPRSASHLPPFGAAGWLVSVLSEPGIRPEPDLRSPAPRAETGPSGAGIEASRPQGFAVKAAHWLAAAIRSCCVAGYRHFAAVAKGP